MDYRFTGDDCIWGLFALWWHVLWSFVTTFGSLVFFIFFWLSGSGLLRDVSTSIPFFSFTRITDFLDSAGRDIGFGCRFSMMGLSAFSSGKE